MSTEVEKYHEEEKIGKTYDFRVVKRLLRYLGPYWKLVAIALTLTLFTARCAANPSERGGVRYAPEVRISARQAEAPQDRHAFDALDRVRIGHQCVRIPCDTIVWLFNPALRGREEVQMTTPPRRHPCRK